MINKKDGALRNIIKNYDDHHHIKEKFILLKKHSRTHNDDSIKVTVNLTKSMEDDLNKFIKEHAQYNKSEIISQLLEEGLKKYR